jgi:hypothetical protein
LAIGTMLEWDKAYGDKASRRERLAVRRAMERMADLAKENFRDLPTTPTFRLSEFLYVLRSADDQRDSSP